MSDSPTQPMVGKIPLEGQEWRDKVIAELATLKTLMGTLCGANGRVAHLEKKVRLHDRLIWIVIGALALFNWLAGDTFRDVLALFGLTGGK